MAAELEADDDPQLVVKLKSSSPAPDPGHSDSNAEQGDETPPFAQRSASQALRHYERVLARSPESFWGHYRAAVVCFQLQQWSEAARHIDCCLKRRSDNAALHGQFASCLDRLGMLDEAFQECSRAVKSAPDYAEFYRSCAFIRVDQGHAEGLEQDLKQFDMLSRVLARGFFRDPPGQSTGNPLPAQVPASQRVLDLDFNTGFTAQPGDPLVEPDEIEPDELDARAALAVTIISKAGTSWARDDSAETERTTPGAHASTTDALEIAAAELDKILTLDPQNITARGQRMTQALEQGHIEAARNDLDLILNRPNLLAALRKNPQLFPFFHKAAQRFARHGLIPEALRIADMAVSCGRQLKQFQSRSLFYKAEVLSVGARSDPMLIVEAARQLQLAIHGNSKFKIWYQGDKIFDPVRIRIDAAFDQLPELSSKE